MSTQPNNDILKLLHEGAFIPAHPLALTRSLEIDEKKQRNLTRYYIASGVDGVAVAVHTTQFEIRQPQFNLLEPVLRIAAEEIERQQLSKPFIKVAGIVGATDAALEEARLAVQYGYHFGLVSMGGLQQYSEKELIRRVEQIAEVIPVFGFYLQPAAGGRILSYEFWRDFVEIPNIHAIKIAAFNRYQTLDVVRALCLSNKKNQIALYTGNDDNIIADLITPYRFNVKGQVVEKKFVGGLLGHWAVWTKKSVEIFNQVKQALNEEQSDLRELLALNVSVTDMNAAIFDPSHAFRGSIAGIHEVLRRQGLMEGVWCLSPEEKLSEGQSAEIDRIYDYYPSFTDDEFARKFS